MKITRALKFRVRFDGDDGEAKKGLGYQLQVARSDLTHACNRLMPFLFALRAGAAGMPDEQRRADGEPIAFGTLAYRALTGAWEPAGSAVYRPKSSRRLAAGVMAEAGRFINARLAEDMKKIRMGQATLSTFKDLPIMVRAQETCVSPSLAVSLGLWAGKGSRITVHPLSLDASQRGILRRIQRGDLKLGSCKLFKARGVWMLSMSYEGEAEERSGGTICGVDMGVAIAAALGFVEAESGMATMRREYFRVPASVDRAYRRTDAERKQRLHGGASPEVRAGHGRARKLRAVESFADKRANIVATSVKQMAAAIIAAVERSGASMIAMEDLWGIKDRLYDEAEGRPTKQQRASQRAFWMRWHQGALRAAIKCAAESRGIAVVLVPARGTSKTCSECGTVWDKPECGFGRVAQDTFKCSCGFGIEKYVNADWNAARNIAQRSWSLSTGKPIVYAKRQDAPEDAGVQVRASA